MPELKFYKVSDEYVNYCLNFDEKVAQTKEENRDFERKYIGIILSIGEFNYFTPLSSHKIKHISMKEQIDFLKIEDKDGLYAVINLNNMIPIPDIAIIDFNIDDEEDENKIFELYKTGKLKMYFSQDTIGELVYLTKIATTVNNYSNELSLAMLNQVVRAFYFGKSVNTTDTICQNIDDPTDEMFLKTSIKGNVDYLISNDISSGMHNLKGLGFKVMTSNEFVGMYFKDELKNTGTE